MDTKLTSISFAYRPLAEEFVGGEEAGGGADGSSLGSSEELPDGARDALPLRGHGRVLQDQTRGPRRLLGTTRYSTSNTSKIISGLLCWTCSDSPLCCRLNISWRRTRDKWSSRRVVFISHRLRLFMRIQTSSFKQSDHRYYSYKCFYLLNSNDILQRVVSFYYNSIMCVSIWTVIRQ